MRSTQQLSVTLPTEMAQMVKAKVASGDYASESRSFGTDYVPCSRATARLRIGCDKRLFPLMTG